MNQKNHELVKYILLIVVSCISPISCFGRAIKDVRWLYHDAAHLDVTMIEYDRRHTTLTFQTDRHVDGTFSVGHGIFIVGDDGERHYAIKTKGIVLDSVYTISAGEYMSFEVEFEPVSPTNNALDVRCPGQFSIYGLHDRNTTLVVPKPDISIDETMQDYSLYKSRSVDVYGVLHDPDSILGDIVQMNYTFNAIDSKHRNDMSARLATDGSFHITFPMFAPQLLSFLRPYYNGQTVNGLVMVRPGDRLNVDLYNSKEGRPIGVVNQSGNKSYIRLSNAPFPNFSMNKYSRNLRYSFEQMTYKVQVDEIMEAYRRGMAFGEYVCWHYQLSPYEAKFYIDRLRSMYLYVLIETDIVAKQLSQENSKISKSDRQKYAELLDKIDYSYLKDIDPDDPTCVITGLGSALQLINQLAPIEDCIDKVPKDSPSRWLQIIALQQEALNTITGWTGQTFVMEQVIVSQLYYLLTKQINPKADEFAQVRALLHHPYSQTCFDIYYREMQEKTKS